MIEFTTSFGRKVVAEWDHEWSDKEVLMSVTLFGNESNVSFYVDPDELIKALLLIKAEKYISAE